MIIMVVETNFAPGDHALASCEQISEALLGCIIKQLCIVRVDADGRVNLLMLFS